MTGSPRPGLTPKALAEHQARLEREALALRENLRKRKAQLRAKAAAVSNPPPKTDEPTAE